MPKVSVIIPTYNRSGPVVRAVDSVLAQSFRDFELIVVDDGSTDDTAEALAGRMNRIIYVFQPNRGVSAARNTGLEAAAGELVAFLDSDDYWLEKKLEKQVAFFDQNPEIMICQTDETWIRNGRFVNPAKKHAKPDGEVFFPSLKLCLISPSAVMMRRRLFDLVGLFDESLPACEDYDLWLRVAARIPVPLIREKLVVKTGGHDDQLSRTTLGLDQYRVQALLKLLNSGILNQDQYRAARRELVRKALVFGRGCLKRGREEIGRSYLDLAGKYDRDE